MNCETINLKRGSKGEQVKEAQTLLKKLQHYNGKIDGDYGELTITAVKTFQKTQKTLAVDGIIGPVTCKKLNEATKPSSNYSYYRNGPNSILHNLHKHQTMRKTRRRLSWTIK